jgi:homogentisate 1,2-dioxygenase
VHRGRGVFATEFGSISYEPGDWVLMPKVTTFRQSPEAGDDLLLVIESPQPIRLCEHEQVGRHTPRDPTMLEVILRPRRASRYSAEASICSDSTKCPKLGLPAPLDFTPHDFAAAD